MLKRHILIISLIILFNLTAVAGSFKEKDRSLLPASPEEIKKVLHQTYKKYSSLKKGEVFGITPARKELVDPDNFGIVIATADGQIFA